VYYTCALYVSLEPKKPRRRFESTGGAGSYGHKCGRRDLNPLGAWIEAVDGWAIANAGMDLPIS
ncbi:MAG: hypothetical protein WBC42_12870, partial [Candidatus Zixiibacteriota bacterium]